MGELCSFLHGEWKMETEVIIDFVPKLKERDVKYVSGNIESIGSFTCPEMCALNYSPVISTSAYFKFE